MADFVIQKLQIKDDLKTSEIARVVNMIIDGFIKHVIYMPVLTAEPTDKQTGTIAYADGTSWDPGAGKGVYEYDGASWNKL